MNSKTRSRKRNPVKRKPRKKVTTTAISVVKPQLPAPVLNTTLSMENVHQITEFAAQLRKHIEEQKLSIKIGDEQFPKADAWKLVGNRFGMLPQTDKPVQLHREGQSILIIVCPVEYENRKGEKYWKDTTIYIGFTTDIDGQASAREYIALNKLMVRKEMVRPYFAYECDCNIVRMGDGRLMSTGHGHCDNMEDGKALMSASAIRGTAETRSISRGFKNPLGFIMTAVGLQSTSAEEMNGATTGDDGEAVVIKKKDKKTPALPELKPEMEIDVIGWIRSGEWTVEKVKSSYRVTPEQEKTLSKFDKTLKTDGSK